MKYQSNETQRQKLLERLRVKPISTIEARQEMGLLGIQARVYELRHWYNLNIKTFWIVVDNTVSNTRHKIALYALLPGVYRQRQENV